MTDEIAIYMETLRIEILAILEEYLSPAALDRVRDHLLDIHDCAVLRAYIQKADRVTVWLDEFALDPAELGAVVVEFNEVTSGFVMGATPCDEPACGDRFLALCALEDEAGWPRLELPSSLSEAERCIGARLSLLRLILSHRKSHASSTKGVAMTTPAVHVDGNDHDGVTERGDILDQLMAFPPTHMTREKFGRYSTEQLRMRIAHAARQARVPVAV